MKEEDLSKWATLMIERIEAVSKDWTKPWIAGRGMGWPKNLSGREYNGMNALMLLLHCEKSGYKIPRFCTFNRVLGMNDLSRELPRVSVNRGEKSFPVMFTVHVCVHKETREKIKYDEYKRLPEKEQERYDVFPRMQVYRVFNVEQTNLREARPEMWRELEREYSVPVMEKGERFAFEPVDRMIADNRWICPIKPTYGDYAYFSLGRNEIVVPEKRQFKDDELFYGTVFHEMTHSTGMGGRLDRVKSSTFGSEEYAREELVAELGSALVAQRYGMSKVLKEDSAAYLKAWLGQLKKSPQFIKTVLLDVKKAASVVIKGVDNIAEELEQGKEAGQPTSDGKTFYSIVAHLQPKDDTSRLDGLRDKGDQEGLLQAARDYYDGNGINERYTYASPLWNEGVELLTEDKEFAVAYNGTDGTYDVMLKFTEREIREHISKYGTRLASDDIKEVAKDMVAEQFSTMAGQCMPILEMPGPDVLHARYNRETDTIDTGAVTNAGLIPDHQFPYDHDNSLEANLQSAFSELGRKG